MQYPFDQSDDDEDVTKKVYCQPNHITFPNKWFSIVSWGGVAVPKDFKILALQYFPLEIKGLLTC